MGEGEGAPGGVVKIWCFGAFEAGVFAEAPVVVEVLGMGGGGCQQAAEEEEEAVEWMFHRGVKVIIFFWRVELGGDLEIFFEELLDCIEQLLSLHPQHRKMVTVSGRSVVRLSRLLWEQEVASSNLAAPTVNEM